MHGPYGLADTSSCKDNITAETVGLSSLKLYVVAEWKENVNQTAPLSTSSDTSDLSESSEE